ncbi:MAG: hypothetical protein ABS60_15815 [Microbacterium sp. SCN 71-17]|nr:MAG: hypothetical protein ABS60_15815 [Microbacterium sp. SCN 71-17]
MRQTSEQQWLRNIVRLRYGEMPTYLDISAITSQFELSSNAGMTAGQERDSPNRSLFGQLGMQFRDAPTLSYTPRPETELTRAVLAPVGITALGLMANSGWNTESVVRLIMAEANGLFNAPGADQLIPETVPLDDSFARMAHLTSRSRGAGTGR